jgi:type IV pilus assembly protein PilF
MLCLQACHQQIFVAYSDKSVQRERAAILNTQLGLAYLKQGYIPRAKKKLLIAMAQNPESADVEAAMAYFFEQTKEWAYAEQHYRKAITLSPGGAQWNNYGAFLCKRQKYIEAERYFLKAIKDIQYINTARAYENAGLCAINAGNYKKAKYYLTKALEQDHKRNKAREALKKIENQI